MKKRDQIYEGKAKKAYRTEDPALYIVEYKDDALGDPMINGTHALAMDLYTEAELILIDQYALRINRILSAYFRNGGGDPGGLQAGVWPATRRHPGPGG